MDTFPDPHELTNEQLRDLIDQLAGADHDSEYLRGVARRKIEVLQAELDRRHDE